MKETCLNGNAPFDYGSCESAMTLGCVALGERDPLLAFNMAFQLEDPAPLKTIARTIRESGVGTWDWMRRSFGCVLRCIIYR